MREREREREREEGASQRLILAIEYRVGTTLRKFSKTGKSENETKWTPEIFVFSSHQIGLTFFCEWSYYCSFVTTLFSQKKL